MVLNTIWKSLHRRFSPHARNLARSYPLTSPILLQRFVQLLLTRLGEEGFDANGRGLQHYSAGRRPTSLSTSPTPSPSPRIISAPASPSASESDPPSSTPQRESHPSSESGISGGVSSI